MSNLISASSWASLNAGLLPKWLLLVAVTAAANSVQAFATLTYTREIYGYKPHLVTPLSGRTFGTWTFLSAIVRLYAAFNIHDPVLYQLAFATYGIAFAHFMSEWFVFGTAKWGRALAGPVFVSTGTLVWMSLVWDDYVRVVIL